MSRITLVIFLLIPSLLATNVVHAQANWEQSARLCTDYGLKTALSSCETAIRLMPEDAYDEDKARVYLYMGIALGELERFEEAMRYFTKASKLDPKNPKIWYNMGVTYAELGRHTKALYAYRKATTLDENLIQAWGNRGVEAYNTKRYHEAVSSFDSALVLDPGYLDTRSDQRMMYEHSVEVRPKLVQMRREIDLRFSPSIGYLVHAGNNLNVKQFMYLMFDTEVDVQLYRGWFATGSFFYGHTKWRAEAQGGGMNIYAPTFGIKYVRMREDFLPHENRIFLDKSRYWFSLCVGPYITDLSAAAVPVGGPFSQGTKAVDIGANVGAGFDYFFYPNVGTGLKIKVHVVNFDDNYFVITFGPHITARF
ncbi:MAG: tetratricopeptide repeat protein [Pseudomonadota bacterium]